MSFFSPSKTLMAMIESYDFGRIVIDDKKFVCDVAHETFEMPLPERLEKFPVVGTTPAAIASLQLTETLKLITGIGRPYLGKLLFWDGEDMTFSEIKIIKRTDCPICAATHTIPPSPKGA